MGTIRSAPQALLFQALTFSDEALRLSVESYLQKRYGNFLLSYGPFLLDDFTDYYREEMGEGLQKYFYLFAPLINLEHSYRYKLDSQLLESRYLKGGRRCLNCDPGFLTLYQLSLLSTKAYSHRNYLRDGIYAETTLIARGKRFDPLPWTYPDYQTAAALDFFARGKQMLRKILAVSS